MSDQIESTQVVEEEETLGQLLAGEANEEQIAFDGFRKLFAQTTPYPVAPKRLDVSGMGVDFWIFLVVSVAAVLLGAERTASTFFAVGVLTGSTLIGGLVAFLSLVAIDGGVVAFAFSLARRRYMAKEELARIAAEEQGLVYRRDRSVDIKPFLMHVGIGVMFLIASIAGLTTSVKIIPNINQDFLNILTYTLAIIMGLGVTVVAYICGEILGTQLAITTATYEEKFAQYEADVEEWNDALKASWMRSPHRKIVLQKINAGAKGSMRSSISGVPGFHDGTSGGTGAGFGNGRRPAVQTERVYQYMDQIHQTEGRIPSFAEVQQVLGLPKSSASRLRKEWMTERGLVDVGANGNGHHEE